MSAVQCLDILHDSFFYKDTLKTEIYKQFCREAGLWNMPSSKLELRICRNQKGAFKKYVIIIFNDI